MHSSGPILKKVVKDDIEKVNKACVAGDISTSNNNEEKFTPYISKGNKTQVTLACAVGTHNTRSKGSISSSSQ